MNTQQEVEALRAEIDEGLDDIKHIIMHLSGRLFNCLYGEGCRSTRCNEHYYLIDNGQIVDPYNRDEGLALLKRHGFDGRGKDTLMALWTVTTVPFAFNACNLEDLAEEAGVDTTECLGPFQNRDEERALVKSYYDAFDLDFFHVH